MKDMIENYTNFNMNSLNLNQFLTVKKDIFNQ